MWILGFNIDSSGVLYEMKCASVFLQGAQLLTAAKGLSNLKVTQTSLQMNIVHNRISDYCARIQERAHLHAMSVKDQ